MSGHFERLGGDDLRSLALALRTGRLSPPYGVAATRRFIPGPEAEDVATTLQGLAGEGFLPGQLARMLDLLAADRASRPHPGDMIELVWTGPEAGGVANRDTGVVVRELFGEAKTTVMIAGYRIYQGHAVFRTLAEHMDRDTHLKVRMYLDVHREAGDSSAEATILARFAGWFADQVWPGRRLPEVYYDPRSLHSEPGQRSSLHAKCVVIDSERSLVSSANFTEAAQLRNLEVGVLIRSRDFAGRLAHHFESLATMGLLRPIPLPGR
jgi:PLD-like domain